jgi:hypothetical protein
LVEHYVYLAENAGEDTADRFLARADGTFTTLAGHREIGAVLTLRDPRLVCGTAINEVPENQRSIRMSLVRDIFVWSLVRDMYFIEDM